MNDYFTVFQSSDVEPINVGLPTLDDIHPTFDNPFIGTFAVPSEGTRSSYIINNNSQQTGRTTSYSTTNTNYSKRVTVTGGKDYAKMSFQDLIKEENLPITITSSFRPGAHTVQGRKSHHSEKDEWGNPRAYDFRPTNGDFNGLLKQMYSNPRVVAWMQAHDFGIIEETDHDTMRRTGAKRPLLHMGPDRLAKQHSSKWINMAAEGMRVEAPFNTFEAVQVEPYDTTPIFEDIKGVKYDLKWSMGQNENGDYIVQSNLDSPSSMIINNNGQGQAQHISSSQNQTSGSTKRASGNSNSAIIMNTLMDRLQLTREQAAGIMGVIQAESHGDPAIFNKKEKAGTHKGSSANGAGYGVGIIQWSLGRKKTALKLIGKENSRIEDLSLEDQIEMMIKELEGPYRHALNGIRKCTNARDAAATFYCHNVAGYSSSDNIATQEEINAKNRRYGHAGSPRQINIGMDYAEQFAK